MSNATPSHATRLLGRKTHRARIRVVAAVLALAVIVLAPLFASYYVDWLWFREVRLGVVFWRSLGGQFVVGPAFGAAFFILFYGNIEVARRLAPHFYGLGVLRGLEPVGDLARRWTRLAGLALSLVIAVLVAVSTSQSWLTFLRARYAVPFGIVDPVFHRDLGFYVFTLPAWRYVYAFLLAALIGTLVVTIFVHFVLGGVAAVEQQIRLRPTMVAHVSVLLAAIFVLVGLGYIMDAWGLLVSSNGVVAGAGYTDVHARLPALRVLAVIAWLVAAVLVANVRWRRRMLPLMALGGWLVALVVLLGIYPAGVQSLVVNPNQGTKEAEFIARNIEATRAAYQLDGITRTDLSLKGALTAQKLEANDVTVRNIRLWDPDTLLESYRQLQELRPYYTFLDVDVDRYDVNGVYRETMLSARQMNIAGLPQSAQTWVNQHVTFTHGYGVAVSAVNQVTSDGSPDFLVQDIPVTSAAPSLAITEPRIYYGELGTQYSLVKTGDPEFDYPGPNGDVYRSYDGSGGIPIGSFVNKLCFGLEFGTVKFFTSSAITARSRIIILNDIRARLRKAAPFLSFDSDPYLVVADGRLYWIADAYTTTGEYPYSQPTGSLNYIRNSVKAVVSAYDGTLAFYDFDARDPLLGAYKRIFPGMFQPKSAMPPTLQEHVRYPEDYFSVQAEVFATYHVDSPSVFYNKGDQWEVPGRTSGDNDDRMSAYYVIMRLPGESREEFVLILPFLPNGRKNMIGWLGAESDPPHYGHAVSFTFPSSQTVYGPAQVEATVNQDPTISSQRTLWGQQGSHVIFGNLLVVPIEDNLLYIQPLYLQAEQTKLPQLKRVVVFYRAPAGTALPPSGQQQNVVMAPSLDEALTVIFGAKNTAPAPSGPAPSSGGPSASAQPSGTEATSAASAGTKGVSAQAKALIARANEQYDAAEAALKTGDFAGYGRDIKELEATLRKLQALP
jgi:uncharacterized membrane protein (UPF0182 family)